MVRLLQGSKQPPRCWCSRHRMQSQRCLGSRWPQCSNRGCCLGCGRASPHSFQQRMLSSRHRIGWQGIVLSQMVMQAGSLLQLEMGEGTSGHSQLGSRQAVQWCIHPHIGCLKYLAHR